jgi:hypothetical protein
MLDNEYNYSDLVAAALDRAYAAADEQRELDYTLAEEFGKQIVFHYPKGA